MGSHKKETWLRWACALFTVVACFAISAHLDLKELGTALKAIGPGSFLGGMTIYGVVLLASAVRLHLVFKATGVAVSPMTSARSCLVGHFLYFALFGVLGGDTARSAFYAKCYGFGLPRVLATAPLDRLLGSVGFLLFAIVTLGIALVGKEMTRPEGLNWWWSFGGLGLLGIVVGLTFWGRRQTRFRLLREFFEAFCEGGKALWREPWMAVIGALTGLVVQVVLSGLLALNLYSVAPDPVPWTKLLWTFPVIAIVAALPVTIGGLGTREGATIALFGMYGVTSHHAVAASLIGFAMNMGWVVVGGLVLLWELRHRVERSPETWPLYSASKEASAPER